MQSTSRSWEWPLSDTASTKSETSVLQTKETWLANNLNPWNWSCLKTPDKNTAQPTRHFESKDLSGEHKWISPDNWPHQNWEIIRVILSHWVCDILLCSNGKLSHWVSQRNLYSKLNLGLSQLQPSKYFC